MSDNNRYSADAVRDIATQLIGKPIAGGEAHGPVVSTRMRLVDVYEVPKDRPYHRITATCEDGTEFSMYFSAAEV